MLLLDGGLGRVTLHSNIFIISVSDPYNFDLDPDPDPRIRIRYHGSGSGSEVTFDSVNRIFPIRH